MVGSRKLIAFVAFLAACSQNQAADNQPRPRDEVQVGYGTQDRATVTGAVATVKTDDMKVPYTRIEELLEARVPGLQVNRLGGGRFSLQLRGVNSFQANTQPLVVLDGIPISEFGVSEALASINPRDVKRIDVLKDGGSTAIYGIRGSNGVILITTRR